MSIIARGPDTNFTPAPEGLHAAICCDVVDLGVRDDGYGEKHKVELHWQLDAINEDTDKRFIVRRRYTLSLNEKASLRKDLETWRAKKFTPEELRGFDLEKLIGVNCQVQVVHHVSDDGRTWANVQAVVALGKGMPRMAVSKDYERLKDREKANGVNGAQVEDDSEIPF